MKADQEPQGNGKYLGRMYIGTSHDGKVKLLEWEYATGRVPPGVIEEGRSGMLIYVIDRYENDPVLDANVPFNPEQWKAQAPDPFRPDPHKVSLPVPEDYAYLSWFASRADFGPADGDVKSHLRKQYEAETGNKVPANWREEGEEE